MPILPSEVLFFHQVAWHEGFTCKEYSHLASTERSATKKSTGSTLYRKLVGIRLSRFAGPRRHQSSRFDSEKVILVGMAAEEMAAKTYSVEEDASLRKIKQTTKLCPGCSWPIEKNDGWDHMKCESFNRLFYCPSPKRWC